MNNPLTSSDWFARQITIGNIVASVTFVAGFGYFVSQTQSLSTELARYEIEQGKRFEDRRASVDATIAAINTRTQPVDSLVYRIGIAEGAINAANARIDRQADALHDSITPLTDKINTLTTRVEVLTSSIDRAFPYKKDPTSPPSPLGDGRIP